jgi:sugar phosphate isomerase/epimerase
MLLRREFLRASVGAAVAFRAAHAMAGDKFRWACTSGFFAELQPQPEATFKALANYGFHGIETSRADVDHYKSVAEFNAALHASGIELCTISALGDYFNPDKTKDTIKNCAAIARDLIAPCGGKHLKVVVNLRKDSPNQMYKGSADFNGPNQMTAEQWKGFAKTLNEIGRGTMESGIKFAIHPHIWSLVQTQQELDRLLELTDPKLVYIIPDTAHLALGGMDPVAVLRDHWARVAAVHFKDCDPKYRYDRGWRGPAPSQLYHEKTNLYLNFGAGGEDFPACMRILRERNYDGWISLDFDPPRPGEPSIKESMELRRKYLLGTLHATLKS